MWFRRHLCEMLLVQLLEHYNSLLTELRAHRDWIDGVETSLCAMRQSPLTEDVDSLQQQVHTVQVSLVFYVASEI